MDQIGNSNLRYFKAREEVKIENFMIDATMINEIIKIGTDQVVVTGEISIGKIEVDQGMKKNL